MTHSHNQHAASSNANNHKDSNVSVNEQHQTNHTQEQSATEPQKQKRSPAAAVVKKNDARLVGSKLSSQSIRQGLVEGIPAADFDNVYKALLESLKCRSEEIQQQQIKEEQYQKQVSEVAESIKNQANNSNVRITDVLGHLAGRDKTYIYSGPDGKPCVYKGRGPKPQALMDLLNQGATLEDFEFPLDDLVG